MQATAFEERLSHVLMSERILLLSHCMRPSQTCPGKFDKKGLLCPEDCNEDCVIRRSRGLALELGYKGVCIAAGGAMAIRFVKEYSPQGIVAVACAKELEEGVEAVEKTVQDGMEMPVVVAVPLITDGCVDTEVDGERLLKAIALGYCPDAAEDKKSPDNRQ
ncbi:DUF116 domain-containing protein [Chloroflexota bacterium]